MRKSGILLTAVAALALSAPISARTFSPQDVLNVCTTRPKDPEDVLVHFRANGWDDVAGSEKAALRDMVALTILSALPSNSVKDKSYWKQLQEAASKYMEPATRGPWTVLHDKDSGAVLLIVAKKTQNIMLECMLAVPSTATKPQDYRPRLNAPPTGELFERKIEMTSKNTLIRRKTTQIRHITVSTALSQPAVDNALGIKTDIAAVFLNLIEYPVWAVTPN